MISINIKKNLENLKNDLKYIIDLKKFNKDRIIKKKMVFEENVFEEKKLKRLFFCNIKFFKSDSPNIYFKKNYYECLEELYDFNDYEQIVKDIEKEINLLQIDENLFLIKEKYQINDLYI